MLPPGRISLHFHEDTFPHVVVGELDEYFFVVEVLVGVLVRVRMVVSVGSPGTLLTFAFHTLG